MKKNLLFALISLISINIYSQEKSSDELLNELVANNYTIGGVAGYSINGEVIWESAMGLSDQEMNQPFKLETTTRMASIAKSMTALAVMQLVEQGKIDLDAPIQTYLPDYPKQEVTQITCRQLLSHTSGIDGYRNVKEAETKNEYPELSDAIKIFSERELLFEPGTRYSYTTYGYTLLGHIIEKVSGKSFGEYMQTNIWDRAGMTNTGIEKYGVDRNNRSSLYSRGKKGKIKSGAENNLSNRVPGGGFYTTVGDMLKFGNAVINNVFVTAETLDLMRQHHSLEKERNAYGFGWFLYNPKPNEGAIIGHSGAQMGCSSQLYIVPEKGVVSIVLLNTSRVGREASILASQLMKKALDQQE